jgi:hypothetical protein
MTDSKLIDANVIISSDAPGGDELMFCHSILTQIGLPRSEIKGREFQHSFGAAWLSVQAGFLDEGTGPVPQPVPHGATARLALTCISTLALRHQTREIDIGRSAAEFLRMLGYDLQGHRYRMLRKQMHALAACRLQLGFQGRTFNSLPVQQFEAWHPRTLGPTSRWPGLLVLSEPFYAELLEHGVPLDGRALAALKGSALALDIYTWLAYRLHRIQGGPVSIPWAALMGQFAHQPQGLHAKETFRRGFLHGLHKVQMVYPQAKVEPFDGGLALHASPPPVAKLKGGSHE